MEYTVKSMIAVFIFAFMFLTSPLMLSVSRPIVSAFSPFPISLPNIPGFPTKRATNLPKPLADALDRQLFGDLPIALNANDAYPTITTDDLPGGPFQPHRIEVTNATLNTPLGPGDYTVNVLAFCNLYSVHQPGTGTAYELAPYRGAAAKAISALLWRGTQRETSLRLLQMISWSMQSGIPYSEMPSDFQHTIDAVIPEYRASLQGDEFDKVDADYKKTRDTALQLGVTLPLSSDAFFSDFGDFGKSVVELKQQRANMLNMYRSSERDQVVFRGQGDRLPPVPAENGPWTVIPGGTYVRFKIVGGNLRDDNVVEIRVPPATNLSNNQKLKNLPASVKIESPKQVTLPSVASILGSPDARTQATESGEVGYAQGGSGAQALNPVPGERYPCNDPSLKNNYEGIATHFYQITDFICVRANPNCTRQTIYDIMVSEQGFMAPATVGSVLGVTISPPIVNCKPLDLVGITSPNPVRIELDPSDFSATNYTLAGHIFASGDNTLSGYVNRIVVEDGDYIAIVTTGTGDGPNALFNECLGAQLWPIIDSNISAQFAGTTA